MIPNIIYDWNISIADPELILLYKVKRQSTKIVLDKNNNVVKEYSYGKGSPSEWLNDLTELR